MPGAADDGKDTAGGLAVDDAMALLSGGLLRDGTPNAPFEDMCAALTAVLERAARGRPVVLVLDDWHAAAPLLVRTVRRLTDGSGCAGVLVVCAGRPSAPSGPSGRPGRRRGSPPVWRGRTPGPPRWTTGSWPGPAAIRSTWNSS